MKKLLISLSVVGILVLGVLGFVYIRYFYIPPLPAPTGAKSLDYAWDYKGQKYTLTDTLFESIDDYYNERPKGIFDGFETRSIERYLALDEKSPETDQIVAKIRTLAKEKNLNDDQTVELAVNFVQAIPYDEERARADLTHPRYPYEVLFANTGICSDKTLLAVSVLRTLGYGTAVFMWDQEQHMAAAVECPMKYSNYSSGYCIVETTAAGAKIGVVPDLSSDNLKAVGRTIGNYGQEKENVTPLGNAEIFAKDDGKVYQGVMARLTVENEIKSIEQYLTTQKNKINSTEDELARMKKQLDAYYSAQNYQAYNSLVPTYNKLVAQAKKEIAEYNAKVERYNYLIKQ